MPRRRRKTFIQDFKQFFTRGLAILLPSVLTLALLWWAYGFLRDRVAEPINSAVRQVAIFTAPRIVSPEGLPEWFTPTAQELEIRRTEREDKNLPAISNAALESKIRSEALAQWWHDRWYMQAIGFIVALVLVYLAGLLVGNLLGKRAISRAESLISSLPILKQVYPSIKQVVEFLLGGDERMMQTNRVVVLEYPRKGIWSVGLLTGETMRSIEEIAGEPCVTVFIPSSPTPFTGYTITVPAKHVLELPVSLDDALRFCVSGGVLVPSDQVIGREGAEGQPARLAAGRARGRKGARLAVGAEEKGGGQDVAKRREGAA